MITKELKTFDAAHRLLHYSGKCSNLHGHTYKCFLSIDCSNLRQNKDGIYFDFNNFKTFDNWIQDNFDHSVLVSKKDTPLMGFLEKENQRYFVFEENPTAENIVKQLIDVIKNYSYNFFKDADFKDKDGFHTLKMKLKLYETPTSFYEEEFEIGE